MKRLIVIFTLIIIGYISNAQYNQQSITWLRAQDITNTRHFIWHGDTIDFAAFVDSVYVNYSDTVAMLATQYWVDSLGVMKSDSTVMFVTLKQLQDSLAATVSHDPVTLNVTANTGGLTLSGQELSFQQANSGLNGYLTNADWNLFNNKLNSVSHDATMSGLGTSASPLKVDTSLIATKTYASSVGGGGGDVVTNGTPTASRLVSYKGTSGDTIQDSGYTAADLLDLTNATDTLDESKIDPDIARDSEIPEISDIAYDAGTWDNNLDGASKNAIRDKLESLAGGHDPVTIGTANGLSLVTQELSLGLASVSSTGALSSTDWGTFNSKLSAEVDGSTTNELQTLTGNVTSTGTTTLTTTLHESAIGDRTALGTPAVGDYLAIYDVDALSGSMLKKVTLQNIANQTWFDANAIQNYSISATAPTDGQVLKYNSGTSSWTPSSDLTGSITSGTVTGQMPYWDGDSWEPASSSGVLFSATYDHFGFGGASAVSNAIIKAQKDLSSGWAAWFDNGSTGGNGLLVQGGNGSAEYSLRVDQESGTISDLFSVRGNGDLYAKYLTNTVTDSVLYISGGLITKGVKPAGSGGTPGGSTGDIQYNNAGVFAGFGNFDGSTFSLDDADIFGLYNSANTSDYFTISPSGTDYWKIGLNNAFDNAPFDYIGFDYLNQRIEIVGINFKPGLIVDENNATGSTGEFLSRTATGIDWVAAPGGGNVSNTGTPVDNQVAVWTNSTTIEGTTGLTYNGITFNVTGSLDVTSHIQANTYTVESSMLFTNISSVTTPGAGAGYLYAKSDSLWYKNDNGVDFNLTRVGTGTVGSIAINDLTDAKTNSFGLFLGANSGNSDDGDNYNVGVGQSALNAITSGAGNVAVGIGNLQSITTGSDNTAIGNNASFSAATTTLNTTSLGSNALYSATGNNNTAIGAFAGDNITSGSQNIIIGSSLDAPSITDNGQIVIGNLIYGTGATGTGSTVSSSGKVGIKNNAPTYELDVTGKARATQQINTVLNGSKTASFTHDAANGDIGAYQVNLGTALTISIHNLVSGAQGTIFLNYVSTAPSTITVNTYSDAGTTGLTERTIGATPTTAINKTTSITYTCASDGINTYVYLVYGQQP